jgi:hypothetical protein
MTRTEDTMSVNVGVSQSVALTVTLIACGVRARQVRARDVPMIELLLFDESSRSTERDERKGVEAAAEARKTARKAVLARRSVAPPPSAATTGF